MSLALPPTINHTITLPDGSTQTYILRSLQDDNDIQKWSEFCASVFSYKATPPPASYFARHYNNDPRSDISLIRVLINCPNTNNTEDENSEIVSSVRIFRRTLSTPGRVGRNNTTIEAGGIGEVCTSPNHQRRGLSKILLKDAIAIMSNSEHSGMECSLLHAAPDFRPVYTKVGGYESVPSNWSAVPIQLQHLSSDKSFSCNTSSWSIRPATFPNETTQLHRLHKQYSESRLITIQRTKEYWNEYISAELGDSLWVLCNTQYHVIMAWIAIRKRGDRYQLREFGVDRNSLQTSFAMRHLLGVALADETAKEVLLALPTFVLSEIKEEFTNPFVKPLFIFTEATEENDHGWMYVNFNDKSSSVQSRKKSSSVLELTTREENPVPHLIWPADSF